MLSEAAMIGVDAPEVREDLGWYPGLPPVLQAYSHLFGSDWEIVHQHGSKFHRWQIRLRPEVYLRDQPKGYKRVQSMWKRFPGWKKTRIKDQHSQSWTQFWM